MPPPRDTVPARWCALPFLILMGASGLPVNYALAPTRVLGVADVAALTAQAASSDNSLNWLGNIVLLGCLYGAAAVALLRRPRTGVALLGRSWPVLALIALAALSVLWSRAPEKVALNVVHNLGVLLIALAAALRYRHAPARLPVELALVLGANMALQLGAVALLPGYCIDWQGRWQALTVHPNTFGALGLTTFWANASVLVGRLAGRRRPYWIGAALGVAAMIGADSVTSQLCAGAALAALLVQRALARAGAGPAFYGAAALGALGLAAFGRLAAGTVDLGWLFRAVGRDSEFTGRDTVWADAFKAIGAHPLLGWSFDDHAFLIASAGMPYSSYHSGVLDLAVNGGVVAVALLLLAAGVWLARLMRRTCAAHAVAGCAAAFGLAYLLHNLTEASFFAPRGQMWQIFLALFALAACARAPAAAPLPPLRWAGVPP